MDILLIDDFFNKKFSAGEFDDKVIWQQLIYEMIFEALGYSKNKDIMLKLAKAVNVDFLKNYSTKENFNKVIEIDPDYKWAYQNRGKAKSNLRNEKCQNYL